MLQNQSRYNEATEAFTQALAIDPDFAAAYFGLGYGLLVQEAYEEAGNYYEQGLLVDDANAAAWNNLGTIYTALERWDEAVTCYESALQIDPAYANAHYNLGNVYKESGQPSDASACYRRAFISTRSWSRRISTWESSFRNSIAWPTRSPAMDAASKSLRRMPKRNCTAPLRGFWRAIGSRAGTNTNGGSGTT